MNKKYDPNDQDMKKYYLHAEQLISKGYPVPYKDPFELAVHLYELNENQSQQKDSDSL